MLLRPWMSHWKSTLAVDFLQRDCCSLQSSQNLSCAVWYPQECTRCLQSAAS